MGLNLPEFQQNLDEAGLSWASDFVPDAQLPVKDEAELLLEIDKRLALIWRLRKQIEIERKAMGNQVLFVKGHFEGKIAQLESQIHYLSGPPIAALKELQQRNEKRKSLITPHGRVQSRVPPQGIDWGDEDELLAQLRRRSVDWAIRVKEEVNKEEIKSHMTVIDGKVFVPLVPDAQEEDLVELEGITIEKPKPTYSIVTIGG